MSRNDESRLASSNLCAKQRATLVGTGYCGAWRCGRGRGGGSALFCVGSSIQRASLQSKSKSKSTAAGHMHVHRSQCRHGQSSSCTVKTRAGQFSPLTTLPVRGCTVHMRTSVGLWDDELGRPTPRRCSVRVEESSCSRGRLVSLVTVSGSGARSRSVSQVVGALVDRYGHRL